MEDLTHLPDRISCKFHNVLNEFCEFAMFDLCH